jgi:hypothetical protein
MFALNVAAHLIVVVILVIHLGPPENLGNQRIHKVSARGSHGQTVQVKALGPQT